MATPETPKENRAPCGHQAYAKAGGVLRCAIMTCDNYYMRHWA